MLYALAAISAVFAVIFLVQGSLFPAVVAGLLALVLAGASNTPTARS